MRKQTEASIQAAFFDWLSLHEKKYPALRLWFAIPNGANKSPAARGLFKRTGLKSGVPDCHLPVTDAAGASCAGLWIEFKSGKGRLSEAQLRWIDDLRKVGHRVHVCRSWTEAADITMTYLNLPLKRFGSNGSTGSTQ